VVRKRYSKFFDRSFDEWSMLVEQRGYLLNISSGVEIHWDIQVGHHLPEHVVFWLIVEEKGRWSCTSAKTTSVKGKYMMVPLSGPDCW
jgi:hypothetical protein